MEHAVDLIPESIPEVEMKYRRIGTAIPGPEPAPILKKLYDLQPRVPHGQPPPVWDHAQGFQVYDGAGNCNFERSGGELLLAPVGTGRGTRKIGGPLMVNEEAWAARQREEITA
jgi:hypothetical protein